MRVASTKCASSQRASIPHTTHESATAVRNTHSRLAYIMRPELKPFSNGRTSSSLSSKIGTHRGASAEIVWGRPVGGFRGGAAGCAAGPFAPTCLAVEPAVGELPAPVSRFFVWVTTSSLRREV